MFGTNVINFEQIVTLSDARGLYSLSHIKGVFSFGLPTRWGLLKAVDRDHEGWPNPSSERRRQTTEKPPLVGFSEAVHWAGYSVL
jgi:hypothetical protein